MPADCSLWLIAKALFNFGPAAVLVFLVPMAHRRVRADLDGALASGRSPVLRAALRVYYGFWVTTLVAVTATVVVFWRLHIREQYVLAGTLVGAPPSLQLVALENGYADDGQLELRRWILLSDAPFDGRALRFILRGGEGDPLRTFTFVVPDPSACEDGVDLSYDPAGEEVTVTCSDRQDTVAVSVSRASGPLMASTEERT